jgi:hypothetical protein
MYRDRATHLDEHDRAVGSIQIADGLITDCLAASKRATPDKVDRWRIAAQIGEDYLAVWQHLDSARRILAARGINTLAYDELRKEVAPVLRVDDSPQAKPLDLTPLDDARRALEELRLCVPGADWAAIAKRTIELVSHAPIATRWQRMRMAVVVAVFGLGVFTWATAMTAEKPVDPDVEMRKELAVLVKERQFRIEELRILLGDRCDLPRAQELIKLYVMDGRWLDARNYGAAYQVTCGDDDVIQKWASAPRPPGRY